MAKKLLWGKFTTDDLVIDSDDDIYCSFPFLKLVGMKMVNKDEFLITFNEVRGIKDTVMPKMVALSGSLSLGWDRTSWPVPYMEIKDTKTTFDRRHTVKSCMNNSAAKEIPGAEYERAYAQGVEFVDIFNEFEDKSILLVPSGRRTERSSDINKSIATILVAASSIAFSKYRSP